MQNTLPGVRGKLPDVGTTVFSVMSALAQEVGAINLSQGFPDFPVDPELIEGVARAMRDGHNQYAPMPGVPVLREAIADRVERTYGVRYSPVSEVTVTAGATQAIFTALAAIIHEGDEAVIIDPAYDCYAPAVTLFGGRAVHVPLGTGMRLDHDRLRAALTPRTRVLIINTPHNPAGTVMDGGDMRAIAAMLDGTDILLVSDEVYEQLIFDGRQHASAILYPELRARAFVVFSFGKVFHATGWKMGYVLAPEALTAAFRKVHQYNVFSVNTPMQHAMAGYLDRNADPGTLSRIYPRKRDRFATGLAASRFRLLPCEGSYFQLVDYSAISDLPDMEFATLLARAHGVAAIPLSPFYADVPDGQRLLRLCFAKQDATLDAAIDRLCRI
jgi:methionine aminotransferase